MSEEFKMKLTKQESLLSEANSKLNHVENDLKTHEIKSNQVIRAMNIQIEKRFFKVNKSIWFFRYRYRYKLSYLLFDFFLKLWRVKYNNLLIILF